MSGGIGRLVQGALHRKHRCALVCATSVVLLTLLLPVSSAMAGRLIETGEVADLSCDTNAGLGGCAFIRTALDYVRNGAPNPSKPILLFDEPPNHTFNAIVKAYGGTPPFSIIEERPRDIVNFTTLGITPANFSAIVVASDSSCGVLASNGSAFTGTTCGDFNSPPYTNPFCGDIGPEPPAQSCEAPDSNRLVEPTIANGARDVINNFYAAGGGILVGSGGDNGDGHEEDLYYDFINAPRGLVFNGDPVQLTARGLGIGLTQGDIAHTGCPVGSVLSARKLQCPFNAFFPLPAGSSLKVAEVDNAGDPVTLFQDTDPPASAITSGPAPLVVSRGPTSASFAFAASENLVTFQCRLDNGPFTPCSSPATFGNLGEGEHVFSVRSIDAAGNVEAAPPAYSWLNAFDGDGDGFTRFSNPPDCNDSDPAVHPGAPEARGGHVDSDCDGVIDPFLRIHAGRVFQVTFRRGATVVTNAAVTGVPVGSTVRISCAGRGRCPFHAKSVNVKPGHTTVSFKRLLSGHRLGRGLVLVIHITGPQSIGFYWSETMHRPPALPTQQIRCTNPGTDKPRTSCPDFSP